MGENNINVDVGNNMFTTKELLVRMETSLNAKMDVMRQEFMGAQATMVSKGELDVHIRTINRDTARIETQLRDELNLTRAQLDEKLKEYRVDSKKDLDSFKSDINASMTRLIMILGVALTAVQFLLSLVTN